MPVRTERLCASHLLIALLFVIPVTGLAGCATDSASTAGAEATPFSGAARAIGVATTEPEPADFVRASRPAGAPEYIPVGVTPPPRGETRRDANAVKKLEGELDAQRKSSRAYAGRPAPKSTYSGKPLKRPATNPVKTAPKATATE
jgi:hypothetical protein